MGRGELMGISFTLPSLHQGLKVEVSFSILSKHVTRDEDSDSQRFWYPKTFEKNIIWNLDSTKKTSQKASLQMSLALPFVTSES